MSLACTIYGFSGIVLTCRKYWLMGVSSSWVIMAHIYRSYWVYGSVKKQQNEDDGSDWSSDEGD